MIQVYSLHLEKGGDMFDVLENDPKMEEALT